MEKTSTKLISCPHCKREFNDNIVWNQFNVNTHVKSCQTKMMPNIKKKLTCMKKPNMYEICIEKKDTQPHRQASRLKRD